MSGGTAASEPVAVSLGSLLRAWGDAGEAPPTAILAAIVHDLALDSVGARWPKTDVDVDAIWIDEDGAVETEAQRSVSALAEIMDLGLSGHSPGRTGDLMPPFARSGIDRFRDWDGTHDDGCEALADWLRRTFGPLPEPSEVSRCARASAPLDPEAPTTLPTRVSYPDATPREALSELPRPPGVDSSDSVEALEVPPPATSDSTEPTTLGSVHPAELGDEAELDGTRADSGEAFGSEAPIPSPADASSGERRVPSFPDLGTPSAEEAAQSGSMDLSGVDSSSDERPVVRKELPSRREATVSVVSAPAARRSARPLTDRGDSILVPAEGNQIGGWILFLIGVGIAVGLYFWLVP